MKKKILIFYGSYGAGHFSAARSIKEYIDANYPDAETQLVDCIEYVNKGLNKFTTKTYDKLSRKVSFAWKKIYYSKEKGAISRISHATNNLFSHKINKLIQEFQPDLVISTHFFSSEMCAILKKKGLLHCKIATVMTDYAPHNQWLAMHELIDYFFVAHSGMKIQLEEKGVQESKIYATGIPLSNRFLMNYNKDEILKEYGLETGKITVLFFASGSSHVTSHTVNSIFHSLVDDFQDIQALTIAGKNDKLKKDFDKVVEETHRENSIKVLSFTDKVPQLMHVSDLVVTKPGGLTTTESLASGLPIIVIDPIVGQEEENATFLEEHGAAIWIKKKDDVEKILRNLFNNPDKIKEMKIKARLLAKKNSTKDICEILLGKSN